MARRPLLARLPLVAAVAVLAAVARPGAALGPKTRLLPAARLVAPHAAVAVRSLAPPASGDAAAGPVGTPFLTPDPDELRRWRAGLAQAPGAVAPGPQVVPDAGPAPRPRAAAPGAGVPGFEGLANRDNATLRGISVLPPDATLAVGPDHVVELVNGVGRITTKAGEPLSSFSLRSFFGVEPGFGESDPTVLYDAPS